MIHIEKAILSSFRSGIVAIRSDGTVSYINPIVSNSRRLFPPGRGELPSAGGVNVFFRVLSEALSMNYLPTRVEAGSG